jgi:murein DD-endopeptidase MepM/ murein hydrolase activator NlpD
MSYLPTMPGPRKHRRGTTALAVLATVACGDEVLETTDLGDLTAVWRLSTTVASNTCGFPNGTSDSQSMILIQCGDEVSVVVGDGLWGTGSVLGDDLMFTGTEVQTDETGCRATHRSTGTVSGMSSLLEGAFASNVTFDVGSCGARAACTMETAMRLELVSAYRDSCMGRDEFGNPATSEYVLPWPVGESYVISNSYCIPTGGHREQQAYDFLIPVGDPIVASRAGVVRQIREESPDNGQGSDHNHVMVEHADGTVAFYAHLKEASVLVDVEDAVAAGDTIALAGHSGTTDVPHLHFGVYDGFPPMEGSDRAVNFRNAEGPLDCRAGLVNGARYTASN